MANTIQDCSYIPLPEEFLYFYTLHCLGCGQVGDTFRPKTTPHEILRNFALTVDTENFVSRIDDEGDGQKFWGNGWQYQNPGYSTETSYALNANVTTQGVYNQFKVLTEKKYIYTYPDDQYMLGMIKNVALNTWEPCIIAEESEKAYYTLETRLFTYPLRSSNEIFADAPDYGILCDTDGAIHGYYDPYTYSYITGAIPAYDEFDYDTNFYSLDENQLQAERLYECDHQDPYNITMAFFLQGLTKGCNWHYYENEACAVKTATDKLSYCLSSYSSPARYLINHTHWSENSINTPGRYMGGILTNCNAYASTIGVVSGNPGASPRNRVVQLPEHKIANILESNYSVSAQGIKYHKSKQCQLQDGRGNIRKKLGVDNGHTGYHTYNQEMRCSEGYLNDRDVILASVNAEDHASGLFNINNNNVKEIEFELFYCANINDPTAVLNLVTFAKKLNALSSGFNTHIPNSSHPLSTNSNDAVTVRADNFNITSTDSAQITYKSSVTFDSVTENDSVGSVSQFNGTNNTHISVIPSVSCKNMYTWSGMYNIKNIYNTPVVINGSNLSSYNFTYGTYIIAYYDRSLYLIDKASYDAYFYNPGDFIDFATKMCAGESGEADIYDQFRYANAYTYNSSRKHGVTTTTTLNTLAGLDLQ